MKKRLVILLVVLLLLAIALLWLPGPWNPWPGKSGIPAQATSAPKPRPKLKVVLSPEERAELRSPENKWEGIKILRPHGGELVQPDFERAREILSRATPVASSPGPVVADAAETDLREGAARRNLNFFTIHLSSFTSEQGAISAKGDLLERGVTAFYYRHGINGWIWYRVCLGFFGTYNQAAKEAALLRREKIISSYRIILVRRHPRAPSRPY